MVGRFNERFLLSLASCDRCLVVDDQLHILPISSSNLKIEPVEKAIYSESGTELESLKESLKDTQPVSVLVNCCKTIDQVSVSLLNVHSIIAYILNTFGFFTG